MSSAFLYLAIVAIWAIFLVPAWLRRPQGQRHRRGNAAHRPADAKAAAPDLAAGEEPGDLDEQQIPPRRGAPVAASPDEDRAPGAARRARLADPEPDAEHDSAEQNDQDHGNPSWPQQEHGRDRMLRARRRMLITLIMLTAAAGTAATVGFAGIWICIPPAGMLAFYLLLLREVAIADAEIARSRQAVLQAQSSRERSMREHPAWQSRTASQPTAKIIDISGRIGDQLYDQYADATARAVGD